MDGVCGHSGGGRMVHGKRAPRTRGSSLCTDMLRNATLLFQTFAVAVFFAFFVVHIMKDAQSQAVNKGPARGPRQGSL